MYVLLSIHMLKGSDMMNVLLIQREKNTTALNRLIELLGDDCMLKSSFRNKDVEVFINNPLFPAIQMPGCADSYRILKLDGKLKLIDDLSVLNSMKFPEWENICEELTVLFEA